MDLYAENILEHSRNPHHAGQLKNPMVRVQEFNPLCGDTITLTINFDRAGKIKDVAFEGTGCAISQAAMSLLSDEISGKKKTALRKMQPEYIVKLLGVQISPARMKCALLGFTALQKAIRIVE